MARSLAWEDTDALFRRCLIASAVFHFALVVAGNSRKTLELTLPRPEVVIDLTLPLRDRASAPSGPIGRPAPPSAQGAPVPTVKPPEPVPTPPAPPRPAPEPAPAPAAPPRPAADPVAVAEPRPAPPEPAPPAVPAAPADPHAGIGTGGNPGGSPAGNPAFTGGGSGTGPGGRTAMLDVLPILLNESEVLANLRRFYPEEERKAGREAKVVVKLLLDAAGKVGAVDILSSGGAAFDAAAKKVAQRMRYSPAMMGGKAIPVAMPQGIVFKLE